MENHPSSNLAGRLFGRYRVEQTLGRGEISEVWLATDTQLRRQVALKILPTALANDQEYLQAFTYEARAAASLEHPHILGIHDFGEEEINPGELVPYLVMPYVPGGNLHARLHSATGPLPLQESLRYLRQAALAIDYAHSRQILHRDIKPANMLLRDDWLLLTDFGLARLRGGTTLHKMPGDSGTPEYMAPEQITGQAQPASDRYSLAVVAYQLFTGHLPFQGTSPSETISQQLQGKLQPPRELNPDIPPRVESLLMQALSRDMTLRPPSCLALVDTLQHAWMSGVQTQPEDPNATLIAPWSKRLRENPSASLPALSQDEFQSGWFVGTGTPSSPVLPIASPLQPNKTPVLSNPGLPTTDFDTRTNTDPGEQTLTSSNSTNFMSQSPVQAPITITQGPKQTLEQKVGRRAILISGGIAAAAVIGGGVLAYELLQHQSKTQIHVEPTPVPGPARLVPGVPLLALTGHTSEVWTARWSPNGRYLMTAGKDGYIMLWDIETALQKNTASTSIATPLHKWTVAGISFANLDTDVCWSPDGKKLIVGGTTGDNIYVLDAFGNSDTPVVYNDVDTSILGNKAIYDMVIPGPGKDQFTVVNTSITASQAQVWNLNQKDVPVINYDVNDSIGALSWSKDKSMLAAMTGGFATLNAVFLWKTTDHAHPKILSKPQVDKDLNFFVMINTIAWSPVDPHLLLVSNAGVALIWDVRKEQPSLILNGKTSDDQPVIGKLAWSPNGRYIVSTYNSPGDGSPTIQNNPPLLVWDVQALLKSGSSTTPQKPSLTFNSPNGLQHTQTILDIDWSPNGKYLATSSFDKTVLIWKVDGV